MFHFIYNSKNFYYNSSTHWISLENREYCPVLVDIHSDLETIPEDLKVIILRAIVYSYNHGYITGQDDKLRDIRRVLGVNFN